MRIARSNTSGAYRSGESSKIFSGVKERSVNKPFNEGSLRSSVYRPSKNTDTSQHNPSFSKQSFRVATRDISSPQSSKPDKSPAMATKIVRSSFIDRMRPGSKKQLSGLIQLDSPSPASTIFSRIKQNFVYYFDAGLTESDRIKESHDPNNELDRLVFETFLRLRDEFLPISGTILKLIAKKLSKKINYESFKASNGWLDRFKKRHELLFKTISGEKNSSDLSTVSNFFADYDNCLETVGSENIFNCDETALYIKRTPSKSFVQFDKCNGIKMSKEKVTLLLCCNALGEKLKPLLIGKFKSPRCLKNFNAEDHGVLYAASKNSWMTSVFLGNGYGK
ncbi:tigger transposable element-derived protein 6-like [Octopus sinensis]|uniref:Tigger transposable element-derived protein 6-like n=1 Tax=Octopus sinensis TaxID=2607531 RepID=A0A6P7U1G3_9MOLL|nr:tigger transposable element-derived protein 6-like [Octopus sinensis]